jgi:hypothetical protein
MRLASLVKCLIRAHPALFHVRKASIPSIFKHTAPAGFLSAHAATDNTLLAHDLNAVVYHVVDMVYTTACSQGTPG